MTEQNYADPQQAEPQVLNSVFTLTMRLEAAGNQIRALQAQVLELQARIHALESPTPP